MTYPTIDTYATILGKMSTNLLQIMDGGGKISKEISIRGRGIAVTRDEEIKVPMHLFIRLNIFMLDSNAISR
jgi:hypothetical protein